MKGGGELDVVPIGRRIANQCQSVPLAIRTLGSLMRYKTSESEWLAIQNKEIWEFSEEENDILAIPKLKVSYDHMPVYSKQWFSYCALFPKGCEVEKKLLIQLANFFSGNAGRLTQQTQRVCI
ncbi:hypothetical protein ACFX2H_012343 [Malus domestica]